MATADVLGELTQDVRGLAAADLGHTAGTQIEVEYVPTNAAIDVIAA